MSQSQHGLDKRQLTQNQNNQMSDDPGDGSRNAFKPGDADGDTPVERAPAHDAQDQGTIEAFGEAGAGIAAKE
ncbi:MAG TPA: hypothetical protein VEY69_08440 [Lautropia sp.]|nr:hypothetical protein [Lautropia sp.]